MPSCLGTPGHLLSQLECTMVPTIQEAMSLCCPILMALGGEGCKPLGVPLGRPHRLQSPPASTEPCCIHLSHGINPQSVCHQEQAPQVKPTRGPAHLSMPFTQPGCGPVQPFPLPVLVDSSIFPS